MKPYLITDEGEYLRHDLNQKKLNIDYKKELLKSKSKIDLNKTQINPKKYFYHKINYQNMNTKLKYNNESDKSFLTQDNIKYNYKEYKQLYIQNNNKSFIGSNNYMMNIFSPKNLKLHKQSLIGKINNNKTERAYKINNKINIKKEKYNSLRDITEENNNIYFSGNNEQNISKSNKNKKNINEMMLHIKLSNNKKIKYIPVEKNNIQNCGNNATTTNNTYNNNIYYINPIEYTNNKIKKKIILYNRNTIHKSVDLIIRKKKINKIKKEKYIKSIVLIQSVFRTYLVKIKVFNIFNLYLCCKKGIEILQKLFLLKKVKIFFKKFKSIFNYRILKNIINSPIFYQKRNSYINLYHKELGDSFDIKGDKNNQKKMEIKINELLKENKELKNKLIENKNIQEKIKVLTEENKKIQSINNIILKDNKQLAKRLKDFQAFRLNKLVIQKDIEKMQIHENNNEELNNKNKIIKLILKKIIEKNNNKNKKILQSYWYKYKDIINNIKNKEKINNLLKNIYFQNVLNIIEHRIKLIKEKSFYDLYYKSILKNKNNIIKKDKLEIILLKKDNKRKNILYHSLLNIIKTKKDINKLRQIKLRTIINKYINNIRIIYRIYLERWNLKSKIIGIRTAARDKKKKRKEKKKINKLLYNKHYLIVDNYKQRDHSNNLRLTKTIQGFNYIVQDKDIINDPNLEEGQLMIGNLSNNNIRYIYKKTKSVNKKRNDNNMNENKEEINSEEDSGDSFGL